MLTRYRAKLTLDSPLTNPTVSSIYTVSQCHEVCRDYTDFDCVAFSFNDYYNRCYPKSETMQSAPSSATIYSSNYDNLWQPYAQGKIMFLVLKPLYFFLQIKSLKY